MDGFCEEEVNPFGPDQLYVALVIVVAFKFNVAPAQIGLLLVAIVVGVVIILTEVVAGKLEHPATVIISE